MGEIEQGHVDGPVFMGRLHGQHEVESVDLLLPFFLLVIFYLLLLLFVFLHRGGLCLRFVAVHETRGRRSRGLHRRADHRWWGRLHVLGHVLGCGLFLGLLCWRLFSLGLLRCDTLFLLR
jgi:hypothetical protein